MSKNGWRGLSILALGACAVAALSQVMPIPNAEEQPLSRSTSHHVRNFNVASSTANGLFANATISNADDVAAVGRITDDDDSVDPFAPRGWQAQPAPSVSAAAPIVTPLIVVPNEAPPSTAVPALPFTFMGRMSDGPLSMVYISRGEESWTVKGSETLDGNYKVVSVNPQQIVFEHLPTGTQQVLPLPEPDK